MRTVLCLMMIFCYAAQCFGQIPIDDQAVSDYEELFDEYQKQLFKSQFETEAQYEERVTAFFEAEPIRYFDIAFSAPYDAEEQEYTFYARTHIGDPDVFGITIPDSYKIFRSEEDWDHYLVFENPSDFNIEASGLSGLTLMSLSISPEKAQDLSNNLEIRIGMEFSYRPEGTAGKDYVSVPWWEGDSYYKYYLIGKLVLLTLYDKRDNTVYWQNSTEYRQDPPVAVAGADQIVFDSVLLNGNGSYDSGSEITTYHWTLTNRENSETESADGLTVTFSELSKGFYDVTLTVTNSNGLSATDTLTVAAAGTAECQNAECQTVSGDANHDGYANLIDAILILKNMTQN